MEDESSGLEKTTQKQAQKEAAAIHRKERAIELGTVFKTMREARGVTPSEVAKAMEVKKGYIEAVERGEKTPMWYTLRRLEPFFDLNSHLNLDKLFPDITGSPGLMSFDSCFVRKGDDGRLYDPLSGELIGETPEARITRTPDRVSEWAKQVWQEHVGIDIEERVKMVREIAQKNTAPSTNLTPGTPQGS